MSARTRRGLARHVPALLAAWFVLLLPIAASAQQSQRFSVPLTRDQAGPAIDLEVVSVMAALRFGGMGFVRVRARNADDRSHRLDLRLRDGWGTNTFDARVELELAPRGLATAVLPMPFSPQSVTLWAAADGREDRYLHQLQSDGDGSGIGALVIGSPSSATNWRAFLEAKIVGARDPGRAGAMDPRKVGQLIALSGDDLPDDWRLISGFDLVMLDAAAAGLDAARESALADHVQAGGDLVVFGADALGAGPLRELLESGRSGFGRVLSIDRADCARLPEGPAEAAAERRFLAFLGDGDHPTLRRPLDGISGPLPSSAMSALEILGLGRVPLRGFFLLILGYAVLIGPVNYFWCRRRRRMPLIVVTTVLLGVTTTALILAWGLFAEGFGVKQAERWFTILDQPRRHAVAWGTRTLYAGFAPGELRPRAGTWTWCSDVNPYVARGEHVFAPRLDGTLGGELVPSRKPTTLVNVAVGPERARLRFRRVGEAREVLADGTFVPLGNQLVLRDLDGRWWLAGEDSRLTLSNESEVRRAIDRILRAGEVPSDTTRSFQMHLGIPMSATPSTELANRLLEAGRGDDGEVLAPGTYLALVQSAPGIDELGITADQVLTKAHLVLGRIGQEDIVD
ncbi:MAG: hypothetical protein IT457_15855 [Planctomycetes bacterium]|nr:hypothetical protein [Planctomycetota bacterium]